VVSSGWSFVSAVLGQMTYLVANLTFDKASSYVMQGASFTQGMISSIPIGGSIIPEGFLPSILLLVVIIVTVVIVAVILVVVVVAIVGVVIVVVGGVSSILKHSFVIIGFLHRITLYYLIHQPLGYVDGFLHSLSPGDLVGLLYPNRLGICIPPGQLVLPELRQHHQQSVAGWQPESWLVLQMLIKFLEFKTSRDRYEDNGMSDPIGGLVFLGSSGTGSLPSGRVDLTGDEDPTDEDGDTGIDDSTGFSASLGDEISSGGKKSQESNLGDSDNTEDGVKTVGEAIGEAERKKHGKYSGLGVREYFEKSLQLLNDDGQGLKAKLAAEKITPTIYNTYKLVDIQAAVTKINGGFSGTIICVQRQGSSNKQQIQEIRFRYTNNFQKQNNLSPSNCGPEILFPAPGFGLTEVVSVPEVHHHHL
ncbi:ribonuclease 2-like protein, partial [Tanacetum coccineum]